MNVHSLSAAPPPELAHALERFENQFPDDPAARCFVRYMARNRGTPPAGWDGAFTPRPEE